MISKKDCMKMVKTATQEATDQEMNRCLDIHTDACDECRTINDDTEWEFCEEGKLIAQKIREGR